MKYNNKKYKVINAKINKNLINDELDLQPISSKSPSILQQILDHLNKIDNRLDKIETTLDEHGEILKRHDEIFKRNNLR